MLVYTTGKGVNGFTLYPGLGVFFLSHPAMKTPKNGKIYSPINKFYKGTTLKFFERSAEKITKKDIFIKSLFEYEEIILVGSGKGVVSINNIKGTSWRRKSSKIYRFLSKIYYRAVTNCPRYNG